MTNTLHEAERIKLGKEKEQLVYSLLRDRDVEIHGEKIVGWIPSSDEEDIVQKIDAWALTESGKRLSVQIKYRDAGPDLGIAAIRPFDFDMFKLDWHAGIPRWDRDMKNKVDIIVCLADYGSKLVVANGHTVHKACWNLLNALAQEPVFYSNRYHQPNMKGGMIQVVRDKGQGYSSGQMKLVIYLEPWLFKNERGMVFNV